MAVTLKNAGKLEPAQYVTTVAGRKYTVSLYVRMNDLSAITVFKVGSLVFNTNNTNAATGQYSFQCNAQYAGKSSPDVMAGVSGASVGSVYHLIFVFDNDDPGRQFFAVNGAKHAIASGGQTIASLGFMSYAGTGVGDVTIDRVCVIEGYAATDQDVIALANDANATAALIAAAASVPGATVIHHSLTGPVGSDVKAGDPAIASNGLFRVIPALPNADSRIVYTEPLACDPALRVPLAYVNSSGRSITLGVTDSAEKGRLAPLAASLPAAPSIRIDDGPLIVLPTTAEAGAYVQPTADAMFFPLPPGVVVARGQRVSLHAPAGWFPAGIGHSPAISGQPVANYAGMPISEGLWPDAKPIRLGTNIGHEAASYYSPLSVNKNRALSLGKREHTRWEDGTLKGYQSQLFLSPGRGNGLDAVGAPGRSGLWAIRWDDYDPSNKVEINFGGSSQLLVEEKMGYRNEGDEQGCGKVRVYDIQFGTTGTLELSAAIDATTTTIPTTKSFTATVDYLVIGDEWIRVGAVDKGNKRFTGCTRGWNGTTAAAHAAGTRLSARLFQKYANIYLQITSPDRPNTHYKNFAIYEPGSWEVPPTETKVSLPAPTAEDNLAIHPHLLSFLEPGIGIFRHMDGTPIQPYDCGEPEDLTRPDDPHYTGQRGKYEYHVESVRPFNPAATPYYYAPAPWPNSETYTATLGAAITTTPPSGTVETITITNGRSAPILAGQVLFSGDERLRVISTPLVGDQYEVERGAFGTATATHSAGEITVGYRIPIKKGTQYGLVIDQYPIHHYEAIFDESLSSPLRFGCSLSVSPTMGDDANVTARRKLTLTAPLTATDTNLYATPDDPGDWDFIAKHLQIVIGSEVLTVVSADPTAGRITVKPRAANAAPYPTGTTARTQTSRVLFQTRDGAAKAYQPLAYSRGTLLPTGVNRAVIATNNSDGGDPAVLTTGAVVEKTQTFDASVAATKTEYFPVIAFPYEFTARLTAAAPGAWHWMNIPHRASDAMVYAAAKAVRDNLPPGRKVIFELSNEVWNSAQGFPQSTRNALIASACGVDKPKDLFLLRSQSAFDIVKRCFAEVGRGNEVLHAICWQLKSEILADCRRLGIEPDAYAVAPYLTPPASATVGSVFNASDTDQICDLFTFLLYYDLQTGELRDVGRHMQTSLNNHQAATGKRPMAVTYEGGLSRVVDPKTPGLIDPEMRRVRDVVYNPSFYFTERDTYAAMREVMGVEAFTQYALTDALLGGATKGTMYFWGMLAGPIQKAGYGDGRDGSANNRLLTFSNPGDDPTTGPDVESDSVRMQAFLDHNAAWRSANPPATGPTDPDPTDPDPTDPDPKDPKDPNPTDPDPKDPGPTDPPHQIIFNTKPRFPGPSRLRSRAR